MEEQKKVIPKEEDNPRIMAACSYFFGFISGLIILTIERKNRFVRFHATQSIITFLTLFIATVILEFIPIVGPVLGALVLLFSGIYALFLISKAIQGIYYKVPHIGNIVEKEV